MNILDHVSNEWQTVQEIQASLAKAGWSLPRGQVMKALRMFPSVIEEDGKFRQVAFHKP